MTKSTIAGLTGLAIVISLCSTSCEQEQCTRKQSVESPDKPVLFETIKFSPSEFGQHKKKKQYAIRNKEEWEVMWFYAHPRWREWEFHRPHPLPQIDFEKEMILGAFQGTCSSTGYSVRIEEVRDVGDRLIAVVKQRTPRPSECVGCALTYPSQMVRVPKSDKPVCFEVMTIKYPKRTPQTLVDGPIDPHIYVELKASPDGKASMWVFLKQPEMPHGATDEAQEEIVKKLHESVFSKLEADEFEYGIRFRTSAGLTARVSASGLEKISKDPNFESAVFEGPSSLPVEWVIEQKCE